MVARAKDVVYGCGMSGRAFAVIDRGDLAVALGRDDVFFQKMVIVLLTKSGAVGSIPVDAFDF